MPRKPPYTRPTMDDVAAVHLNGLRVVSTFSGCGGSCLGFRLAGYRVLWASEFVPEAAEVYRANHPGSILDTRDIREVTADSILSATGLDTGELDVFEGSPPCASFSLAGARAAHWGQVKKYSTVRQRTDDLFLEYARLLDGLRPRVFVAENVPGLTIGKAKPYFNLIFRTLRGLGYRVRARVLNAAQHGVPQARRRLFFIGVRDDLERDPVYPSALPYAYSVSDAIELTSRPPPYHPDVDSTKYAVGREWQRCKLGGSSERYFQLQRCDPLKPCPTILQGNAPPGAAGVMHPYECRKFTIEELKALSSFPADFRIEQKYALAAERIGRAVPPLLMREIALKIREVLR